MAAEIASFSALIAVMAAALIVAGIAVWVLKPRAWPLDACAHWCELVAGGGPVPCRQVRCIRAERLIRGLHSLPNRSAGPSDAGSIAP